jgi:hypothetical protein
MFFSVVAHVLGISEFQCLCDLGIRHLLILPKVVGELLV